MGASHGLGRLSRGERKAERRIDREGHGGHGEILHVLHALYGEFLEGGNFLPQKGAKGTKQERAEQRSNKETKGQWTGSFLREFDLNSS
jgi:hypothetical protein